MVLHRPALVVMHDALLKWFTTCANTMGGGGGRAKGPCQEAARHTQC